MNDELNTEFARLAAAVWGFGYQTKASRHFDVADRTVRRWCSGDSPVPANVMAELRQIADIRSPPEGSSDEDDRDDACYDAIEPAVGKLAERAVANGWSIGEVLTALLAISVSEMKAKAGDKATRQTLEAAIMMLDE